MRFLKQEKLRILHLKEQLIQSESEAERRGIWAEYLEWCRPKRELVALLAPYLWDEVTRLLSDEDLAREHSARARLIRDLPPGQSRQVCPICLSLHEEAQGIFVGGTFRFECDNCGTVLVGDAYEVAFEGFLAWRYGERKRNEELVDAARGLAEALQ